MTGAQGNTARAVFGYTAAGRRPRTLADCAHASMTNILVTLFAVFLCLVNAVIWAFISEMPLVGIAWVGAATLSYQLHKWSRY